MATRAPRYPVIPSIPQQGLSDWEYQTLNALKENVDLLTGSRGRSAASASAITRGSISVVGPPAQTMTQVSAVGAGFTVGGVLVPSLDDYTKLVNNVQQLANDVAALRSTVEALVIQLRG